MNNIIVSTVTTKKKKKKTHSRREKRWLKIYLYKKKYANEFLYLKHNLTLEYDEK